MILYFDRLAERYREIEYKSAVKIQAWYRGVRLRAYLKYNLFFRFKSFIRLFTLLFHSVFKTFESSRD